MPNTITIPEATDLLKKGGIIAYPTEGVYGLGCDPFNELAVTKLLTLKDRNVSQGLILIATHWEQVAALTKPIPTNRMEAIQQTWPGPITWLFPASEKAPKWITGKHDTIALRITNHKTAKEICEAFNNTIVSTSANRHGDPAPTDLSSVQNYFPNITIVEGELGTQTKPTPIFDALSGKQIR